MGMTLIRFYWVLTLRDYPSRLPGANLASFCAHEQKCYMYNVYLICYGQKLSYKLQVIIFKFTFTISAIFTM